MDPWQPLPLDRGDVDAILTGVFDANDRLVRLTDEVIAIRSLLEDYGEEEDD